MPPGFDVESISGAALSHWTELKTDAGPRHHAESHGQNDGQQQFIISLSGPGVKATNAWTVPQLFLREAGKQRGTLLVVPEQGMRLQADARDGVTQLDPQKSGIPQKGVLAFRVLQSPWNLALDIEQVDPWIQVTSLQHATVNEAQVKVTANLQYQIENAGLKAFHVFIPTNAEGVTFQGDQVARFSRGGRRGHEWFAGMGNQTAPARHRPVSAAGELSGADAGPARRRRLCAACRRRSVNLQRGFVTVQSGRASGGAGGRSARGAAAGRMAEHPARAATGFARRRRRISRIASWNRLSACR